MKMIELSKEQFEEFANNNSYYNFSQTESYGKSMTQFGFEYSFVGYTTNDNEILAAGMFLIKKIGSKFYYAYSPKGFIIDYNDFDLLRRFTHNLIKYYKRKKVILLKINPEIPIAVIDYKNNFDRTLNENATILDELKKLGYKKRKEIEPLQLIEPKLKALIYLKDYSINNLNDDFKKKIKNSENKGFELEIGNSSDIDCFKDFILSDNKSIDFYKKILDNFKQENQVDLILIKVNYEKYLISSKKKVEEEQNKNDELNSKLQKDGSEKNLNEKMKSDLLLEEYKQDVVYATNGLKNDVINYAAGAIVIKFKNRISILISGINKNLTNLNPQYFLYNKIFELYKADYEVADLNEIADDFGDNSEFKELNEFKIGFNPKIIETIGELDLILSEWRFKIAEQNNLLSNEFTKK